MTKTTGGLRLTGSGNETSRRMFPMRLATLALAALGAVFAFIAPAHAQLRVQVEGVNFVPLRIAVPDFDASGNGAAEAAANISQVIRQDLAGSAVFEIVDKAAFIEKDVSISLMP